MPSIDLYVNYGVHGVRDCSRPAMAMDGRPIQYGSGYLQSGSAHRRRTLAYLQSRDEPIKALGSSHMTK